MRVLVVVAQPRVQEVTALDLPEGATVAQALAAARVAERFPGLDLRCTGVWGRRCGPDARLRDGDRVEVYRDLQADAKALRRTRAGLSRPSRSRSGR